MHDCLAQGFFLALDERADQTFRVDGPIVGRDAELQLAANALATTSGIVIAGAAGVGKSRLAREVFRRADVDATRSSWFAATHSAAIMPFGAVADLVPDVDIDVRDPARVLRFVRDRIVELAEGKALVIGLDDAHLVDDATAALLHLLVLRGDAKVIVTIRTGETVPDAIRALWKDGQCERLDLQALSRQETATLTEAIVGGAVDSESHERLWSWTEGNALFLREVIGHALESGALRVSRDVWTWTDRRPTGPRLVEVVELGLDRVSESARAVLRMVAFGEPLGTTVLDAAELDALGDLVKRGVVTVEMAGRRQLIRIAHPMYGEVVRQQTSVTVAGEVCRRLLGALLDSGARRRGDQMRAAALALHAGVDLPLHIIERAAREALIAGDADLAGRIARLDRAGQSATALWVAGQALIHQRRDFDEAIRLLERARQLDMDDELRVAIAVARHHAIALGLGRYVEAESIISELEGHDGGGARGLVGGRQIVSLVQAGQRDKAVTIAALLIQDRDERVALRAMPALGALFASGGQLFWMKDLTANLLDASVRLRDELPQAYFTVFAARLFSLLMLGELDDVDAMLDEMVGPTSSIDRQHSRGYASLVRGRTELFRGRVLQAIPVLRDAVVLLDRDQLELDQATYSTCLLAESYALVGRADEASRAAALAAARTLHGVYRSDAERSLAWALVARGEISAARESLRETARLDRELGALGSELVPLFDIARLGGADEVAMRMVEIADAVDGRLLWNMALHAQALASDDAAALDAVSRSWSDIGANLFAAEAAAAAASAYERVGLKARAAAAIERHAHLRSLCPEVRTPAMRVLPSLTTLTDREREVAELAARGNSNRVIASLLSVSVRTVEGHLLRSFPKLGVKSREELTEVLRQP